MRLPSRLVVAGAAGFLAIAGLANACAPLACTENLTCPDPLGPGSEKEDARPANDASFKSSDDASSVPAFDVAAAGGDANGADAMDGAQADGANVDANYGAGGPDAADAEAGIDATDAGTLGMGLVAYYPFDESSGATSADASGNGRMATMVGATFAPGVRGNAVSLNGTTGFVSLPTGIVSTLTSFSICTWVNLTTSPPRNRIWDFGTGTTAYMALKAMSAATPVTLEFAITTTGFPNAQKIDAALPLGTWQHVCVTLAGGTGAMFVNGALAAQMAITLNPSSLGVTTQDWLGRSQFAADPLMNGLIDEFRIYNRALTSAEILQLFLQQL
jgi:hypothetical protein